MNPDLIQRPETCGKTAQLPVVCIGISTGGLKPLKALLRSLPSNTGMAFVVLHHLRRRPTLLPEILSGCNPMPILLATDRLRVQPDHIYVLPSGKEMVMSDSQMIVRPGKKQTGWSNVITTFLLSMANSKHPGIAIILSGLDHDGAAALKTFKQHGGMTIAQDLPSAEKSEMPRSAIRTGAVDYVVAPEAMAPLLEKVAARYQRTGTMHA